MEGQAGAKVPQGETNIVFEGLGSNKLGGEGQVYFKYIYIFKILEYLHIYRKVTKITL